MFLNKNKTKQDTKVETLTLASALSEKNIKYKKIINSIKISNLTACA